MPTKQGKQQAKTIAKAPTGISGMDDITGGGLPKGRPTLVSGSAGCGKTLLAMEFLVNGAVQFDEPGVFIAFEENAEELAQNVASLGFDLKDLIKQKKLIIDYIRIERNEIEEAGEYDLDGLFIRLGHALDSIKAKRVALDTIEVLFGALKNQGVLRAELHRLFRWLKDKGVSAIVTAERGDGRMTRHGLEEFVADCVILLDHRVTEQLSTRRMRIVKYRGTLHGTNEYPFLIGRNGISVLPITSLALEHEASRERISTGIPELDEMLDGKGFYCGSSVLVSGTAGSGKSSVAASFVDAACRRGEKSLYFSFEESPNQILRNMKSIGLDLDQHVRKGMLRFHSTRPSLYGLEMHLVTMYALINEFQPRVVVLDPITDFTSAGSSAEIKSAVTRVIDFLKTKNITALFVDTTPEQELYANSTVGISSLIDAWIGLRNIEANGEHHRGLHILKSRGMAHSNQVRPFLITDDGIEIGTMAIVGPFRQQ